MLNTVESRCLADFRSGAEPKWSQCTDDNRAEEWVRFGLHLLLEAGRRIRTAQTDLNRVKVILKEDGSPSTLIEKEIEALLGTRLASFAPLATVVGEESGGGLISSGTTVAIDPIDGTWAFLSGTQTYATTLTVFEDGVPILGMIGNSATGEIGYASSTGGSRLLQSSVFGEPETACPIPEESSSEASVLVNIHPSRKAGSVMEALYESWQQSEIGMVRSPGGSPSYALLEAAKGHFTYVNLWSESPSQPYDLAAGVLVVRGAGGEVTNLEGLPINALDHRGPFVAGVDGSARKKTAAIVRGALGQE
jgi:myo-inositol-1(or 4)-monophosphatase